MNVYGRGRSILNLNKVYLTGILSRELGSSILYISQCEENKWQVNKTWCIRSVQPPLYMASKQKLHILNKGNLLQMLKTFQF